MKIFYQDSDCIVLEKTAGAYSEDVPGGMLELIRKILEKPSCPVYPVHRLDTPVCGITVYALSKKGAAFISKQVEDGNFVKEYLCITAGSPAEVSGEMRDFLFKDGKSNKVFVVKPRKGSKEAILNYNTIATNGTESLCSVHLITGRTHQIRVQFAFRKMPIHGDGKYGSRVNGQMQLFCVLIGFRLPSNGKTVEFSHIPDTLMYFRKEAEDYLSSSFNA